MRLSKNLSTMYEFIVFKPRRYAGLFACKNADVNALVHTCIRAGSACALTEIFIYKYQYNCGQTVDTSGGFCYNIGTAN